MSVLKLIRAQTNLKQTLLALPNEIIVSRHSRRNHIHMLDENYLIKVCRKRRTWRESWALRRICRASRGERERRNMTRNMCDEAVLFCRTRRRILLKTFSYSSEAAGVTNLSIIPVLLPSTEIEMFVAADRERGLLWIISFVQVSLERGARKKFIIITLALLFKDELSTHNFTISFINSDRRERSIGENLPAHQRFSNRSRFAFLSPCNGFPYKKETFSTFRNSCR